MAALFALFGMFAIYRLQIEGNKKTSLISDVKTRVNYWADREARGISLWTDAEFTGNLKKALKKYEERFEQKKEPNLVAKIRILKEDIKKISDTEHIIHRVKAGLGPPIQLVFYTFSLSITALLFAEYLSNLSFGFLLIAFIIILTLITAYEIIKFTLISIIL